MAERRRARETPQRPRSPRRPLRTEGTREARPAPAAAVPRRGRGGGGAPRPANGRLRARDVTRPGNRRRWRSCAAGGGRARAVCARTPRPALPPARALPAGDSGSGDHTGTRGHRDTGTPGHRDTGRAPLPSDCRRGPGSPLSAGPPRAKSCFDVLSSLTPYGRV